VFADHPTMPYVVDSVVIYLFVPLPTEEVVEVRSHPRHAQAGRHSELIQVKEASTSSSQACAVRPPAQADGSADRQANS